MISRFGRVSVTALACAVISVVCHQATAYTLISGNPKWFEPTLDLKLMFPAPPAVLLDGSLSYYKSLENALALWNEQMRDFQFTWTEVPGGTPKNSNGTTEVSMQPSIYGNNLGSGTLAVTFLNYSNGQMHEADVVFNVTDYKFNSYRGFVGANQDFHRIALHELGHVLGLDHSHDGNAIMYPNASGTDHLQADDITGVQSIYGAPATAPTPTGNGRVANISTRVRVGTDAAVMIGGFIVVDSTKPVLIRALGPSLSAFGVDGALADPTLELHNSSGAIITANDNWKENAAQAQAISATGIPPTNDRESAIYANLAPGAYTAVVAGKNGSTGVGLVEVYDLAKATGKIGNIATRAQVGTGQDVLIGGFIVSGPQSVRVIVRAIGPSLSAFLPNFLADPMLELRDANGDLLQSNDNWDMQNQAYASANLEPKSTLESALVANLAPGNFTAIVRGKNGGTGIGLVEIYDVPIGDAGF